MKFYKGGAIEFDVISFNIIHYIITICRDIVNIGTEMQFIYRYLAYVPLFTKIFFHDFGIVIPGFILIINRPCL